MAKLRLNLDGLVVESFAVTETPVVRGTVRGNEMTDYEPTCPHAAGCGPNDTQEWQYTCGGPGDPTAAGETCGDTCENCMTAGFDCVSGLCTAGSDCFPATFGCPTTWC